MIIAQILPDTFQQLLPGIQPWVENLKTTDAAVFIQGWFAQIQVFHILGLFMLGGATILTSLRLIGVGLTEVPVSEIHRNTRVWLHIGIWMAIISGVIIGVSNAEKLYNSSAFLYKMIAMIAGIIFSTFVVGQVAKNEGVVGGSGKIWAIVALLIWAYGLIIMAVKEGSNPGFFHLTWAGMLICFATIQGKLRWVYGAGVVVIAALWQLWTHVIAPLPADVTLEAMQPFYALNRNFMILANVWVFGFALANILGTAAPLGSNKMARLIGYSAILVWVTVGAGGRWIGLS